MSAHSPRPWVIAHSGRIESLAAGQAGARLVALVAGRDGTMELGQGDEESGANLKLIAAAPEFLHAAVHALRRVQTEPEFRWHMLATETFHLLCRAVAIATDGVTADVTQWERRLSEDRQPEYRRREPRCAEDRERVQELERRIEELERLCHEHGVEVSQ